MYTRCYVMLRQKQSFVAIRKKSILVKWLTVLHTKKKQPKADVFNLRTLTEL